MMRLFAGTVLVAVVLAVLTSVAASDAIVKVRIDTETDDKGNTVYFLVNSADKTVTAKVECEKRCSSLANNQKPVVHEYRISRGGKVKIGMMWSRSTCRRTYRIIEASYPQH